MVKAAKKRKKREEDESVEIPEFDEVAYMTKEVEAAKLAFVLIALSVVVALLLFAITVATTLAIVAFFVGLLITFALPRLVPLLPWPKIDLSKFERKDWISHGGTFMFAWLAFWILFLNVPFVDVTPPTITGVSAWNGAAATAPMGDDPTFTVVQSLKYAGKNITVNATVLENSNALSVEFQVNGTAVAVSRVAGTPVYSATFRSGQGAEPKVRIFATDGAGHTVEYDFKISVT